jgi:hypothetical protein
MVAVTRQRFIDRVINRLENHVVQACPIVGIADVHTGPLANCIKTPEDLDVGGIVTGGTVLAGHKGYFTLKSASYTALHHIYVPRETIRK